jgi:ubiquinone/menaquinone biosynthesis C-methylase UbiE
MMAGLFDEWPEKYDAWFRTPNGALVKKYEGKLVQELLRFGPGQTILDAGCGTGVFTIDMLSRGARVVGLDISIPMLNYARGRCESLLFHPISADLSRTLPFKDESFDKVLSVTAIEFIEEAEALVAEMFRVTQKKGRIVVATLNSLSPWAARRIEEAKRGHPVFQKAVFRSPEELRSLAPIDGLIRTAIYFQKDDNPERAIEIEKEGQKKRSDTGAFVAIRWIKP